MPLTIADFMTVPEELLGVAVRLAGDLEGEGYAVTPEPYSMEQPRTPVMHATRAGALTLVEVASTVPEDLMRDWADYAKTRASETRVVLAVPSTCTVAVDQLTTIRTMGVGIYVVGESATQKLVLPQDLTVNIPLTTLTSREREVLGGAWELLGEGRWKEGFEEACIELQQLAAAHLRGLVSSGQLALVTKQGRPLKDPLRSLGSATLGSLAIYYGQITSPNSLESRVGSALGRVNDDRVTVAHFKNDTGARQEKLRRDVARNIYVVLNAVRELL